MPSWTEPRTWADEELIDETIMNAHVRDNLRYLKGLDGVVTTESGLIIDNTDGDEYLLLPSLTTAERNALSAVNGMIIYNETTEALNAYQNSGWGLIGVTDHGDLTGLTDVADHAYAFLHNGTRAMTGALTVGANAAGHTVTFYGDTSGSRLVWYDPGNQLYFIGATSIMGIGTGALNWSGHIAAGSLAVLGTGTFQGGLSTASS